MNKKSMATQRYEKKEKTACIQIHMNKEHDGYTVKLCEEKIL